MICDSLEIEDLMLTSCIRSHANVSIIAISRSVENGSSIFWPVFDKVWVLQSRTEIAAGRLSVLQMFNSISDEFVRCAAKQTLSLQCQSVDKSIFR